MSNESQRCKINAQKKWTQFWFLNDKTTLEVEFFVCSDVQRIADLMRNQ